MRPTERVKKFITNLGYSPNAAQAELLSNAYRAAEKLEELDANFASPEKTNLNNKLRFKQGGKFVGDTDESQIKSLLQDFYVIDHNLFSQYRGRPGELDAMGLDVSLEDDTGILQKFSESLSSANEELDANDNQLNDVYEAKLYDYSQPKPSGQTGWTKSKSPRYKEIRKGGHSDWGRENIVGGMSNAQPVMDEEGKSLLAPDDSWLPGNPGLRSGMPIVRDGNAPVPPNDTPPSAGYILPSTSNKGSFWGAFDGSNPTAGELSISGKLGGTRPVDNDTGGFADANSTNVTYPSGIGDPNERPYGLPNAIGQGAAMWELGSRGVQLGGKITEKGGKIAGLESVENFGRRAKDAANRASPTNMIYRGGKSLLPTPSPTAEVLNDMLKTPTPTSTALPETVDQIETIFEPGDDIAADINKALEEPKQPQAKPGFGDTSTRSLDVGMDDALRDPEGVAQENAARKTYAQRLEEFKKNTVSKVTGAASAADPVGSTRRVQLLNALQQNPARFRREYYDKLTPSQRAAMDAELKKSSRVLGKGFNNALKKAGLLGVVVGVGQIGATGLSAAESALEGDFSGAGSDLMLGGQQAVAMLNPGEVAALVDEDTPLSIEPTRPTSQEQQRLDRLMAPQIRAQMEVDQRRSTPFYLEQKRLDDEYAEKMATLRQLGREITDPAARGTIADEIDALSKSRIRLDMNPYLNSLPRDERAISPFADRGYVNIYDPELVAEYRKLEEGLREERAAAERARLDELNSQQLDNLDVFNWTIEDFQN